MGFLFFGCFFLCGCGCFSNFFFFGGGGGAKWAPADPPLVSAPVLCHKAYQLLCLGCNGVCLKPLKSFGKRFFQYGRLKVECTSFSVTSSRMTH